jgi:uncharacterized UBP type Zn finger protein
MTLPSSWQKEHAISQNSLLNCGSYSSININELSGIVAVHAFFTATTSVRESSTANDRPPQLHLQTMTSLFAVRKHLLYVSRRIISDQAQLHVSTTVNDVDSLITSMNDSIQERVVEFTLEIVTCDHISSLCFGREDEVIFEMQETLKKSQGGILEGRAVDHLMLNYNRAKTITMKLSSKKGQQATLVAFFWSMAPRRT